MNGYFGDETPADTEQQMMRGQRALRDSQPPSPSGSEDDEARSPLSDRENPTFTLTPPVGFVRGRKGQSSSSKSAEPEPKRDALDVMH
jgi:hypothetical protein